MSLHSIVEPAETLQTGWHLAEKDPKKADVRNSGEPLVVPEPAPENRSKWELADAE